MSELHTAPVIPDVDLADDVELPSRKGSAAGLLKLTLGKIATYLQGVFHAAPVIDDADLADDVELTARKAATAGLLRITLAKIKTYLLAQLLPAGGTTGQVLKKASNTDFAVGWGADNVGSGGATTLDGLTDVDTSTVAPTNGQILVFSSSTGLWTPGSRTYKYGSFAVSGITASEVLMDHIVAEAHTLADDFAGCVASVGTNPAATWVADIRKNGASVGSLSISTTGVVTFNTTGTTVALAVGDILTLIAPASVDASIARLRFTFKGSI